MSEMWWDRANCADSKSDAFFDPTRYAEAQLVCMGCPVTRQCLSERRGAAGVWGGKVFAGSKDVLTGTGRALKPHGTEAAQARHRRKGEPLCQKCRNVITKKAKL